MTCSMRNRKSRASGQQGTSPPVAKGYYHPRKGERNRANCVAGLLLILLVVFLVTVLTMKSQGTSRMATTIGDNSQGTLSAASSRRFPRYGAAEFARQCNWTKYAPEDNNCTLLLRPKTDENEGLADWVSRVVSGHISAKMRGCQFYIDYGPEVDVQQVLTPYKSEEGALDWTVPPEFKCTAPKCEQVLKQKMLSKTSVIPPRLAPNYRYAYQHHRPAENIYRKNFEFMHSTLPGFDLETGMACAFEGIMGLSNTASQFEPDLFTRILPTLRDERNLVMTFYYRTGTSDVMVQQEKDPSRPDIPGKLMLGDFKKSVQCLLEVEKEYLSSNSSSYSRVVWLLVSDSQFIKQWVTETYPSPNILSYTQGNDESIEKPAMPREIMTTTSHGKHTRAARNPSTADFAEGVIDWYLIGESDMVFVNGYSWYSYGVTAALRTHRPLYDCGIYHILSDEAVCAKLPPFIREGDPPTWNQVNKTWGCDI